MYFGGKRGGDTNLAGDVSGVVFSSFGNKLIPWTYNKPLGSIDCGAFSFGFNFGGDVESPI